MLHVSHPTGPVVKKIDKVKLFLEIIGKFQEKYTPSREVAVDETMLKFCGRFTGKQYMPKKPIKWGVRFLNLANI